MVHFWRNNDDPAHPWSGPAPFGAEMGQVDAVSLIQSNFSAGAGIGNLELITRVEASLSLLWRDDLTKGHVWSQPDPVAVNAQVLAIHAALLHTQKIIYFGGDENDKNQHDSGNIKHTPGSSI